MTDIKNRTAFVTGGASGMGLGIAKALAHAGARVAIADIRDDHLEAAVATGQGEGVNLTPYRLDVTDRAAHSDVADAVERDLGAASIIILNAGIGVLGHIKDASYADWDWIMGVNLGGVLNGVRTFVPRLRALNGGGHVLATSSMGGLVVADSGGIYSAAKFGVTAMMECLREDLAGDNIGVSVLCPAAVNTNIHQHHGMRPAAFADGKYTQSEEEAAQLKRMLSHGMDPDDVGALVVEAIVANKPFIFTDGGLAPVVRARRDALIASLPDEPRNEARWQQDLAMRQAMRDQAL
ncbi:SDR family NAD(P)-dependent oxidoreductase [Sphingobium sp. Leaf26]|uniref:SDR family NAD(P)-dependent oxidoreductase n=1 Tax=Sphingobium sp. Leaf26 TaxID=1735693 RepID=UPI0009EBE597|nr:SDR family NAD(P)-dependent oxidoreductase [Sphingobium sp. Leaf26]